MGVRADWAAFADAWRAGYRPAMDDVRSGRLPWTNIDGLHRRILDRILDESGLDMLSEAEKDRLNRAWHRLAPWPDAVRGLKRLKKGYLITTLSNGNVRLLTNMAKHAGLPWDCVLGGTVPPLQARSRGLSGSGGHARLRAARGDDGGGAQGRSARGAGGGPARSLRRIGPWNSAIRRKKT